MGAKLVKEAASKTSKINGDGTTTATVLAEAIFMKRSNPLPAPMRCHSTAIQRRLRRNRKPQEAGTSNRCLQEGRYHQYRLHQRQ
jgi:hypothetical protein